MRLFVAAAILVLSATRDWYDIATIIIAGLAVFIGIGSLYLLREQAKSTEKAAQAAKDSADAVMNSERAWVLVEITGQNGKPSLIQSVNFGVRTWSVAVDISCSNQGRTPAWIVERRIALLPSIPVPEKPPLDSANLIETEPITLLVGQSPFVTTQIVPSNEQITDEEHRILYGVIKYRDIYGKVRQTTFGYRVGRFYMLDRMSDYPAYNEHT
jgi:hypothetical protein